LSSIYMAVASSSGPAARIVTWEAASRCGPAARPRCSTTAWLLNIPFPAAVDDAFAAYEDLLTTHHPGAIALAGDSAGGGLVAALIVRILAAGLPSPACIYCISPWVDLANDSRTMALKADVDPLASQSLLTRMSADYLDGAAASSPLASPIHADLRSAPPALIQVGSAEVLLTDSVKLAQAMRRSPSRSGRI